MGLSRTVSEINGAISVDNRKVFPPPVYLTAPLYGFPLRFGADAFVQKLERWGLPGQERSLTILSRLDTIHQCDRRTDGRTPADTKQRAYA